MTTRDELLAPSDDLDAWLDETAARIARCWGDEIESTRGLLDAFLRQLRAGNDRATLANTPGHRGTVTIEIEHDQLVVYVVAGRRTAERETFLAEVAERVRREGSEWLDTEGTRLTESEWAQIGRTLDE